MDTIVSDMIFKILIEWDGDSRLWVTRVPELNDLSTFGETEEEALQMTKDAILGYLEAVKQVGEPASGSKASSLTTMQVALSSVNCCR